MSERAITMETGSSLQEVKWGRSVNDDIDAVYESAPLHEHCSCAEIQFTFLAISEHFRVAYSLLMDTQLAWLLMFFE